MLPESRILIVEDDVQIRNVVREIFLREGAEIIEAGSSAQAIEILDRTDIDLIILDLGLPDSDGVSFTKELKENRSVPVLILTGRMHVADMAIGLEVGADDYVTKPFNAIELTARAKAIIRRNKNSLQLRQQTTDDRVQRTAHFAGWTFDFSKALLKSPEGAEIETTDLENKYLSHFLNNPDRNISRAQLEGLSSKRKRSLTDRAVDVMIGKLRKKLNDDPSNPTFIRTVRNRGFRFVAEVKYQSQQSESL